MTMKGAAKLFLVRFYLFPRPLTPWGNGGARAGRSGLSTLQTAAS